MDARMKVDRAATRLLMSYPFWGSLFLGFNIEETTSVRKTVTNGAYLKYNPQYVLDEDDDILCTTLAHECEHKALLHNFRRGQRDQRLWNVACDYVINAHLKSAGFTLGADWLYDPQFDGMSEEEVYDFLNQHPEEQPDDACECGGLEDHPSVGQSGKGDEGDEDGGADGSDMMHFPGTDDEDGDEDSDGEGDGEEPDGSASDGQQPIATPSIGQSEADIRVEVSQARDFAHAQAGLLPGDMERAVEELLNPKIRPEEVLQQFMEQCAADDFSWLSPDRRFLNHGMYLPGMQSEGIREFVIAVDASGSVNQPMYDHFASIISKIAQDLPFETLHVLFCDTAVRRADTYTKADLPIDCQVKAGGGTRFSPVFEHLEREGIIPSGLVYLTDLQCSDFPEPPLYKVLWLVDGTRDKVPFGDVLNVEDFR